MRGFKVARLRYERLMKDGLKDWDPGHLVDG